MKAAKKSAARGVQIQLTGADESDAGSEDWDFRAAVSQIEQQDGARFQLTRTAPKDLYGFVGEILPAEFSPETIRERFGPGVYRIRAIGPDNLFMQGGGRLTIAPTSSMRAPPVVAAPANGATDVAGLLVQFEERRARESRESADKWMRWAAILGPIFSPVLLKLVGGNPVSDVVTLVAKLKELSPPAADNDRLDTFLRALEYARDNEPRAGGGDSSWIDLAREGLSTLKPAVAGFFAGAPPPAPAAAPVPALAHQPNPTHAPPVAAPAPGAQASDPMLRYLPWLRGTLEQLVLQAAGSKNPALYAEVVMDNLPAGLSPQTFHDILKREDWWQLLGSFYAPVQPYQGWFTLFRTEAMQLAVREFEVAPGTAATEEEEP